MAKMSLEELLNAGIPLEDILFNRNSAPINVTVDTDEMADTLAKVSTENRETLKQIGRILEESNKFNRDFMIKAFQLLLQEQQKAFPKSPIREIKGLQIIRDSAGSLDRMEFIR